ncbi:MAG: endonuclease [Ignavibacteria bacterium]|nr:endonuclease [Ignavibacteria bacterium]
MKIKLTPRKALAGLPGASARYFSLTAFIAFAALLFMIPDDSFSQAGTYYNSISTSSPTFVNDLKSRVRSPYNRVSYDNYDETVIANYASINNGNGTRSVFCVYSGYEYIYSGAFTWTVLSREHTWAHSWMPTFPSTQNDQYSDQYMLFPAHQNNANARRSNHPFGYVVNVTYQFLEGKVGTDSSGNIVYEPMDSFKGDLARALLYAVIRYDDVSGNPWSFNWLNNTKLPSLGEDPQNLQLLLAWHRLDPPDKWEVERSNYVQSVQLNRNPFIDRPEYESFIDFGNVTKLSPVYAAEPSSHIASLASSVTGTSVTINWNDATGAQLPAGYMIIAYNKNNYYLPVDGSVYAQDTLLSDGFARVFVPYSGPNSYTFPNLVNNTRYYFTVYSYNGSGTQINYKIDGTWPQTNVLVNPALATEPTNHATGFGISGITSSAIQLSWTDAIPGTQVPSGYLLAGNNTGDTTSPSDGLEYVDDFVLSDGQASVNIPYTAANNYTFTGLLAGTSYHFRLYSYNGEGTQINYKTVPLAPQASGTTTGIQSAAVTILADNFSRANSNILGNTLLPSNIPWVETETVSPGSLSVSSSRMKLASTTAGRDAAFVDMSQLDGYRPVFSDADTTLVWAFNMRQTRADPSGHDNNNYGLAFILGKSTQDLASGNGYAVVLGQSGSTDAVRIAKFTGGMIGNARFTNIVSGGDYSNQYLSVRVTFQPSGNVWSLYVDSSSAGFPQSDPRNSATQIGSASDGTFTSGALPHAGALWNHVTGANDSAVFDDIYFTELSLKAEISVIPEGLLNESTVRLNMRDTVTAFLMSPDAPFAVVDSAKAVIDSVTFTGSFSFSASQSGSYYIAVKHRNSIETWSNIPVSFTHGSVRTYDFTSLQGSAFGNNMVQRSGKYCIYSGDANKDGTIDGFDLSMIDNDAFTFVSGYIQTDLNGDGFADASDASLADNNAFNFVSKIVP